jgi:hypothetical protein
VGAFVGVALAFGLSSCGSGGGGTCGTVQPCGGDATGTWKISTACISGDSVSTELSQLTQVCPSATATLSDLTVTGTITFNADATYAEMLTESGTVHATVPASCLAQGGLPLTCAQLPALIALASGMSGGPTVSCTGSSTCSCTARIPVMTTSTSGTWSRAGTSITLMAADGTEDGGPYCVQGDQIHLISVDMTMSTGPMGTAKIVADLVGTKQP